ncbi:hypothetical protein DVB69_14750 [Sporosarcina sp. BI001-red]|uniref:phosphotransferase enzyme family protein n=1 Tax=Sporosarcina sp. BI001-red TaxID=2282866 RepID=UPI000E2889EE|nr:hypothetical protein [Sporosarcina sp. BI001-red]REB05529.1 hypothetical protein DVB69_14750 [Sporosarcina sp. BI001-red]
METEKMSMICRNYNIRPEEIESLRSGKKVLAKVKLDSNSIYLLKGERAEPFYWDACCQFASLLHENDMNVSRYLKDRNGSYVQEVDGLVFTLEHELAGHELTCMTDELFYEIGRLLGVQHQISMQLKSPFTTVTSWSMFGGNATENLGDYDENELSFLDFKNYYQGHPLFTTIETLYFEYRKILQEAWTQLPQGAVQGDFCYYNMVREENGTLGIYDFNIAGNEVFLNESVAVGVYHAWHAPYTGNLTEQERFKFFIESYTAQRPFTERERMLMGILKSVIRAFRYDRVEAGVSLVNVQMREGFLQETLTILKEVSI